MMNNIKKLELNFIIFQLIIEKMNDKNLVLQIFTMNMQLN